jgi:ubiquinol-cytochrome c reductase cytochrome c1 subunit
MVRPLGILVGFGFCMALVFALVTTVWTMATTPTEDPKNTPYFWQQEPRPANLPSSGPFAQFDRVQLQRGFRVYKEVCAACHGLNLVSFRNLEAIGYSEDQVKTIAAEWPIQTPSVDPNTGEAAMRAPIPTDRFPSPYPNEIAARAANNNAIPPDLSLIVKARAGHQDYIYSLLTGYRDVPAELPEALRPGVGLNYNPYFASLNIAMANPLTGEGQVTYDDGTRATPDQMARDVTAFLVWTSEPKLENRIKTGWAVLGFLLIFTILAYMSYRSIWAEKKGR